MKRLILIVAQLLCMAGVASAIDLDNLLDYRHQMRRNLGLDTASTNALSDTSANEFVREAVMTVIPSGRYLREEFKFVTSYRDLDYSLDTSLVAVEAVVWTKNDSLKALTYAPMSAWVGADITNLVGENGYNRRPSRYDYIEGTIYLNPTPVVAGDTIRVVARTRVKNIAGAVDMSSIPQQFRWPILKCATWLAANARQDPRSVIFYQEYQNSLGKADVPNTANR